MQGNCSEEFPTPAASSLTALSQDITPALWPQKPGQCLLRGFSGEPMYIGGTQSYPIWLDNLYIREGNATGVDSESDNGSGGYIVIVSRWGGSYSAAQAPYSWITRLTIQGNGRSERIGLGLTSPSYLEGALLLFNMLDSCTVPSERLQQCSQCAE